MRQKFPLEKPICARANLKERSFRMRQSEIAYHEAGHAVIAAVLGILRNDDVISVVSDNNGEYGYVTVWKRAYDFNRRSAGYIRKRVLSIYAGPAVSKKLNPRLNLFQEGGLMESDMVFAEYLMRFCAPTSCQSIGDSVFESFKEQMWKEAQDLISSRWADIAVVAKALLKWKTLNGDEVKMKVQHTGKKPKI